MAAKSISDLGHESPTMEPAERLTPDEIRERAYDLWDRHHRPEGYDLQFWLMAERELKAEQKEAPNRGEPKTQTRRATTIDL